MADVKKYTDQIAKAQKGRDVRDSIVNAINAVSDENNEYNQVKSDILAAQSDIAEKVAKNEQTEQTFAADVKKAEALKQGLDSNIEQGTALKSQLETTISTADTGKKNLDASNTTAAETKADLDASNATASETKTGLDATNKTAAGLVTSLGDKIAEGTQVKTDIQTTGETAMSNLQAEAAKQQEYIKTSIDDTLSVSGKAADAAVTGKKIDSLKEDLSNKITKFYASNQGETHLADSDNGKIMDMMLYGKSEQKQYSGKNLLNVTFKTDTYSGVTLTNNGDGTYTIEGTNNSSGELIFSLVRTVDEQKALYNSLIGKKVKFITESGSTISGSVGRICFVLYNETEKKYSNETYNGGDVAVPTGYDLSVVDIHIYVGQTVPKTIIKPMITTDLTATYDDFEPYTGGIPSPNPDYPQEIKSVVNPTVKVCGKNLLKATLESTTKNGITCTNNGDGTYTLNGTANGGNDTIVSFNVGHMIAKSGKYIVVGCPKGESSEKYNLRIGKDNIPWGTYLSSDLGNGRLIDVTENAPITLTFMIKTGYTCDNVIFKPMIVDASLYPDTTYDDFEPYHEQTVTLPYTLNAVPVETGGNVTIDGQQYIADYVDVERGKLVRMVANNRLLSSYNWNTANEYYWGSVSATTNGKTPITADNSKKMCACKYLFASSTYDVMAKKSGIAINNIKQVVIGLNCFASVDDLKTFLANNDVRLVYPLEVPTEIDLTSEEVQAFKSLATYYPVTNIFINSEQLDGYTVFNYPISMANGWNYVKKQLNDNRDYIYDMDIQSAEAYVNSEYAVALTELEV